jgi:TRAP-type C4-dicarboxylate transport system substrate-binding protein
MRFVRRLVVTVALLYAPGARAQVLWDMATEYPRSSMSGQGLTSFAAHIDENTRGGLVIRPSFDGESGLRSAAMLPAIVANKVQAGDAYAAALDPRNELFSVFSLPAVVGNLDEARRLSDLARPAIAAALRSQGAQLLYVTPSAPTGLWTKQPLRSAADLKALTVRTYDLTTSIAIGGTGAQAMVLSFNDTLAQLRDGGVNAVLSSEEGGMERKLSALLPHFSAVAYTLPVSIASVNAAAYDRLSPDLKAAVDLAARDTEAELWSILLARIARNQQRMREQGVAVDSQPPPDVLQALKRAGGEMRRRWCGKVGAACQAILNPLADNAAPQ